MSVHFDILVKTNRILTELGRNLGMPTLTLDESGALSLVFDGRLVVEMQLSQGQGLLFLMASVVPMPSQADDLEKLAVRLLETPLLEGIMNGAQFVIDSLSEEILLLRAVTVTGLDATLLEQELNAFVACLTHWQKQVRKGVLCFQEHPQEEQSGIPV